MMHLAKANRRTSMSATQDDSKTGGSDKDGGWLPTCPIEAAAIGSTSNSFSFALQPSPSSADKTPCKRHDSRYDPWGVARAWSGGGARAPPAGRTA